MTHIHFMSNPALCVCVCVCVKPKDLSGGRVFTKNKKSRDICVCLYNHLFNKQLRSTYYTTGIVLGTGHIPK